MIMTMTASLSLPRAARHAAAAALLLPLAGCSGVFDSAYDEPPLTSRATVAGELYIDASDWGKWHYIDLPALAEATLADPGYNTSDAWVTYDIPMEELAGAEAGAHGDRLPGIYTYWYDVFGAGISSNEYRSHYLTAPQPAPEGWTIAVHRNNARTNGCAVAATTYTDISLVPTDEAFLRSLSYSADRWSESEVWCEQSRMLLGLIGNQGIDINPVLSSWLRIDIPPMPPAFTLCDNVYVVRLPDATYAALQLTDYQSVTGTKCCMTIKYRYPL